MRYISLVALIMAILLLASSCNLAASPVDTSETALDSVDIGSSTSQIPQIYPDYEGRTFMVLGAVDEFKKNVNVTEDSGDTLETAVYEQNRIVSERYNVSLNYLIFGSGRGATLRDVKTALSESILAGDSSYDMVLGNSGYISSFTAENYEVLPIIRTT